MLQFSTGFWKKVDKRWQAASSRLTLYRGNTLLHKDEEMCNLLHDVGLRRPVGVPWRYMKLHGEFHSVQATCWCDAMGQRCVQIDAAASRRPGIFLK
eukprot:4793055-Amphidinium_carterae.1